ncbi:DNA helicase UvrD [Thermoflavimicrobium daqui]|uniref:DNA 3'-5' helicase n=1 Tax=Thermoflavimicrobium daqui TaxID=2137476 RepID=A0A364K1H8_9BACL|nr:DNA helicase UvrD [Thermoflavimicrobium daqui]
MVNEQTYIEQRRQFFIRTARAWQKYFDAEGLLPGITPSDEQKAIIQQEDDQLMINGSAGSGKSITLMYKLLKVMKQEQEPQRILYVTYNKTLLDDSRKRLEAAKAFHSLKERHQLHMVTFHQMVYYLMKEMGYKKIRKVESSTRGMQKIKDQVYRRIAAIYGELTESKEYKKLPAEQHLSSKHTVEFLVDEIRWIKENGFITKEKYLQVERTGRSHNPRLTRQQRKTIFKIYEKYQEDMEKKYHHAMDLEDYALELLKIMDQVPEKLYYDYIFIDEVQDLQPMQIFALAKLKKKKMVLTGDPKQRIYKTSPHSYSSLGLNLSGRRNRTLRQNFRSTRQIMLLAESLEFEDVENDRLDHLTFVREGERPMISYHPGSRKLANAIIRNVKKIQKQDPSASIAIIHRDEDHMNNGLENQLKQYLQQQLMLISTEEYRKKFDHQAIKKPVFFTDVYSVKGLEFDHVFVIQFDRFHYPSEKRLKELEARCTEGMDSDSFRKDFDHFYSDEKKLLYVAITRAKQTLQIMYAADKDTKISQFIRDFPVRAYEAKGFDKSKYGK